MKSVNPESWTVQLQGRLNELTSLKKGWDGYDGIAVKSSTAQFASEILNTIGHLNLDAPSLVPGSDGSLQIEWHIKGFDLEIDIGAPTHAEVLFVDKVKCTEISYLLSNDFTLLIQLIKKLEN